MRIRPTILSALLLLAGTAGHVHPGEKIPLAIVSSRSKAVEAVTMERAEAGFRGVFAAAEGFALIDTTALENQAGRLVREERDPSARLSSLLRKSGAAKAVVFILEASDGRYTASARVLDIASASFEYESAEPSESEEGAMSAAAILARRLLLHLSGTLDWIAALSASDGESADGVLLSWSSARPADGERYLIYRAPGQNGEFGRIAETAGTEYLDAGALPGLRYWYRVRGSCFGTLTDYSEPEAGHRRAALPRGLDIDRVLKGKNAIPPRPSSPAEREKAERDEEILKPLYRHPVKLNLILLIARSYIKKGDVMVLRGFDNYSADTENSAIEFTGPGGSFSIEFRSKRLFRFREKAGDELFERLLGNSLFYCVPAGEREMKTPDGAVVFVPRLEAIAVSMEYHRNDRNWRERTIMFDTDVKELKEKIERAGQGTR